MNEGYPLNAPISQALVLARLVGADLVVKTVTAASGTEEAIKLQSRSGGTSGFTMTLTPLTLTAARTWSLPDRSDTFAGLGAQTFTGAQRFNSGTAAAPSPAIGAAGDGFYSISAGVLAASFNGVFGMRFEKNILTIAGNSTGTYGSGAYVFNGLGIGIHGDDGQQPSVGISAYGSRGEIYFRRANGTGGSPTAVVNGNLLGVIRYGGWQTTTGTTYQNYLLQEVTATENWTDVANGVAQAFYTIANGTVARLTALYLTNAGQVQAVQTTDSTSSTTGALLSSGGLGVAKNIYSAATIRSTGATSGIGYDTGAGGTVTQATSRSTGVTLNKASGAITLVSAAGSTTPTSFTVTNSAVAATDAIILNQKSGTDKYILLVTNVAAGSFQVTAYTTGGTTTEQPVIKFAVIKCVEA